MRSFLLRSVALVVSAALFSACGGGGGGTSAVPSKPATVGTSAPTGTAPASFTISFHPYATAASLRTRRPQFVSPATKSMQFSVVSVNGVAPAAPITFEADLTSSATGCTTSGGTTNCTVNISLPLGTVVLSAASYNAVGGMGGGGTRLGSATISANIQNNIANVVTLSVSGIVSSVQLLVAQSQLVQGLGTRELLAVIPFDAAGAQIVNPGTYSSPITVTSNDTTGHIALSTNNGAPGSTATVASPNDQVTLVYDGSLNVSNATLTAATTGAAPYSLNIGFGSGSLSGALSGPNVAPASFVFTATGQTSTLTVTGGTGPYTVTSSNPSVATATPQGTGNYTVTSTGLGTAQITVTDSGTPNHATFTKSVVVNPPPIGAAATASGGATVINNLHYAFAALSGSVAFTLSGGTGTYSVVQASGSANLISLTGGGASWTVTPNGGGTDFIIVTSGSQTAYLQVDVAGSAPSGGPFSLTVAPTAHAVLSGGTGATTNPYELEMAASGTVQLTASGGTGTYSISPSGCSGIATTTTTAPAFTVTAIAAGTCSAVVSDTGGATSNVLIEVATPVSWQIAGSNVATTTLATDQVQSLTLSGGYGVYTNAAVDAGNVMQISSLTGNAATLTAIASGTANATANDALGQVATLAVTVSGQPLTFVNSATTMPIQTLSTGDTAVVFSSQSYAGTVAIQGGIGAYVLHSSGGASASMAAPTGTGPGPGSAVVTSSAGTVGDTFFHVADENDVAGARRFVLAARTFTVAFNDAVGVSVTDSGNTSSGSRIMSFSNASAPGAFLAGRVTVNGLHPSYTVKSNNVLVATVSAGSGGPFTQSISGNGGTFYVQPNGAGTVQVDVTDSEGATFPVVVVVTTTTIPISSRSRKN